MIAGQTGFTQANKGRRRLRDVSDEAHDGLGRPTDRPVRSGRQLGCVVHGMIYVQRLCGVPFINVPCTNEDQACSPHFSFCSGCTWMVVQDGMVDGAIAHDMSLWALLNDHRTVRRFDPITNLWADKTMAESDLSGQSCKSSRSFKSLERRCMPCPQFLQSTLYGQVASSWREER